MQEKTSLYIVYLKRYKTLLDEFLNEESLNLTVGEYVKIEEEIKEVEAFLTQSKIDMNYEVIKNKTLN